jgi:hypothetical protein
MAYELRNTATEEDIRMLHREWELLLVLAERYGWHPAKGRNYARGGRFFHMDAVGMSAALSRALLDIPHSYADGYTEEERLRAAPLRELRPTPVSSRAIRSSTSAAPDASRWSASSV